jgi:hypothetical protein
MAFLSFTSLQQLMMVNAIVEQEVLLNDEISAKLSQAKLCRYLDLMWRTRLGMAGV